MSFIPRGTFAREAFDGGTSNREAYDSEGICHTLQMAAMHFVKNFLNVLKIVESDII